jgi:Na+-driven multidrug efflux pump
MKMLITVVLSLYSTRIVLKALGVEDYGIYSLIGGVVALLGFLNASMAVSTQRFISFNLGKGNKEKLNEVLNTSIVLHFGIALIVAIVLELAGVYLFKDVLNIPGQRIVVAKVVYHFMVLSTFFTIVSVPFTALIDSHEHFITTTLFDVLSAVFKLLIALFLLKSGFDKLLMFGFLTMLNILLIVILKSWWSMKKYKLINYNLVKYFDKITFFEMSSFAGWNTFGSVCNIGRSQGVAVIMNYFFGATINAAYGIANLINSQLFSFSASLLQAFNPQILKSEGSNNRRKMLDLAISASKFSFLLLSLVSIPILIEMPYVLGLWLEEVPDNTIIFSRLIIIITLANQLGSGLPIILQAVGDIKWYQIVVGSLVLLILPIGFLLLYMGCAVYSILIVSLCIECVAFLFRLYFAKRYGGLSILYYLKNVIYKIIPPFLLSFAFVLIPYYYMDSDFLRFVVIGMTSTIIMISTGYKFSLLSDEKVKVMNVIINFKK